MKAFGVVLALVGAGCGFRGNPVADPDAGIDAGPDAPLAPPILVPELKDFGPYDPLGPSQVETFTIQTVGPLARITTSLAGTNAADFTLINDNCNDHALASNASCTISVRFAALQKTGARTATLRATAAGGISLSSELRGRYDIAADVVPTPSSIPFGTVHVGTTSPMQMITLLNPGTLPAGTLTTAKSGTDATEFTIVSDTCNGQVLGPLAMCIVQVAFAPNGVSDRSAAITVSGSLAGAAHISLSGTGEALTFMPSPVDFGSVALTTTSPAIPVTVKNVAANAVGPLVTARAGNHPGDFAIANDTCNGVTLASNTTCTLDVTFAPTVLGARNALVRITVGGVIIADDVIQGTGIDLERLMIDPLSFAFPDTTAGQTSTAQAFTVTNAGTAATGPLASSLGGTDPTQFAIVTATDTCTGHSLPIAGTCTIEVTFTPTTAGAKSSSLTLTATPGGTVTAPLTGTGL